MAAQPLSPLAPNPLDSMAAEFGPGAPMDKPTSSIDAELARLRSLGLSTLAVEQQPIPSVIAPRFRNLARSIATGEPFEYTIADVPVKETEYPALLAYAADKVPPEHLGDFMAMVQEEASSARTNARAGMLGRAGERMGRATQQIGQRLAWWGQTAKSPDWQAVYDAIDSAANQADPIQPADATLIEKGLGGAAENIPNIAATLATIPAGPLAVPLATGFWFSQLAPERIQRFKAAGATETDAQFYGGASALVESSIETLVNFNPFGKAIGIGKQGIVQQAKKWLAARGIALGKEVAEEQAQAASETVASQLADSAPPDPNDPFGAGAVGAAVWRATVESLPTLIALQGAGSAVRFASELPQRIENAKMLEAVRKRLQAAGATKASAGGQSGTTAAEVASEAAEDGLAGEVSPQVAKGMRVIQTDPKAAQEILDKMTAGQAIARSDIPGTFGRMGAAERAELGMDVKAAYAELQALAQKTTDRTRELLEQQENAGEDAQVDAATESQPDDSAPQIDFAMVAEDFLQTRAAPAQAATDPESTLAAKAKPGFARITVDAIPGGVPQNAQLTIQKAYQDLDVGLTTRNRSMGNTLGFYRPSTGGVTLAKPNMFSTGSHELGHAMDHEFGLVQPFAGGQVSPYDSELMMLSVYGSSPPKNASPADQYDYTRNEGVAEFVRAWLINPKAAGAIAPKFAAHFEAKVDPDIKARMRAFGDAIRQWAALTNTQKTDAQIADASKEKTGVKRLAEEALQQTAIGPRWWVWLQDAMLDQNYVIVKVFELLAKANGLDLNAILPRNDVRILLQRMSGIGLVAERFHSDGPLNFDDGTETGTPGVVALYQTMRGYAKPYELMRKALDYMVSQRVIEKAGEIEDLGVIAINAYDIMVDPASSPKLAAQARKVYLEALAQLGLPKNTKPKAIRAFVAAKLASGLSGAGTDLGSDIEVAKGTVAEFKTWTPDEQARVKKFAALYRAYADDLLRYYRDSGRMSDEEYQRIRDRNMYYIDMHRVAEQIDADFMTAARRLGNASNPLNRFRGSGQQIDDPVMGLIAATHAIVGEAERARTINAFIAPFIQSQRTMNDPRMNLAAWADIGTKEDVDKGRATPIYINGKMYPLLWKDQELAKALKRMYQTPAMGLDQKWLMLPARIMRVAITNSPVFILRQPLRDAQTRIIQDDSGTKLLDGVKYLFGSKSLAESQKALERAGGGFFSMNSQGRSGFIKTTQQYMKEHLGDPTIQFTTWEKLSRMWSAARQNSELLNRLPVFEKAYADGIAKGYDEFDASLYAMSKARDLQDFARGGHFVKAMDRYLLFVNPSIIAIETMYRKAKADPVGMAKRVVLFAVLAEALILLFNEMLGAEKYRQQEPSYVRDTFYKIYTRDLFGFDIVIPKPYQYALPGAYMTRAYDALMYGDTASMESRELLRTGLRAFAPVSADDLISGVISPMTDLLYGRDRFRDRYIIPPHEAGLALHLREGAKNASAIGRFFQPVLQTDARNIDYLMQSAGAGFGRTAIAMSNFAEGKADMVDLVSTAFGLTAKEPVRFARDVDWLYRYSAERGESSAGYMRKLSEMLEAFYAAEGEQKRLLGRQAVDYAAKMRKTLDK